MQFCERLLREAGRGEARSGELDAYRPKPQPARSDPLLSGPSGAAEPGQGSRNMGSGGQRPVLKLKDLQAPSYVDLVVQVRQHPIVALKNIKKLNRPSSFL
jgi:hypothetical protein